VLIVGITREAIRFVAWADEARRYGIRKAIRFVVWAREARQWQYVTFVFMFLLLWNL